MNKGVSVFDLDVADSIVMEMEMRWDEVLDDPYYDDISPALYRNLDEDIFWHERDSIRGQMFDELFDSLSAERPREEEDPREEELELLGEMVHEQWRRKDEQEFVQVGIAKALRLSRCCSYCAGVVRVKKVKAKRAMKMKTKRIARRHREGRITAHLDDIQVIWDAYEWRQEMMRLTQEDLDRDFW